MKRLFWIVLIALITAAAIWYGLRVAEKNATRTVTSLLPGETLLVVHLPDFNHTRGQWHQTDIHQIRQEPAVRDFLQKPLSRIPKSQTASEDLAEFEKLEPKDIFLAVTSWTDGLKLAAGFRFKGRVDDAEKLVAKWRTKLLAKSPETKSETVAYEQHQIQTFTSMGQMLATVYDKDWFLAANDLTELKAILDRVDDRSKGHGTTLADDATFSAAFKHMPPSYAALVYGRFDRYFEKMMPILSASGANLSAGPTPIYRQLHAFCGTLGFEGGKIHDVLFIGMPQLVTGSITRDSLVLGTKDTFFYLDTFLNLPNQMTWPMSGPLGSGLPGALQKFVGAAANSGISMEEWNSAFGPELGMLGDWPAGAQWPALLATVPIKDQAKADQIFSKMTTSPDGTAAVQDKDGVRYFTMRSAGGPFSIAPTVALSKKMLIAGTSESEVEDGVKRSANAKSELADSGNFRDAEKLVPPAKNALFYIDSALLYSRLDAALRPILLMGAAFIPSISENVDLTKFPPAETITKHLSPIVMSQNYQTDGYVTESVGPVTIYQAAGSVALVAGVAMWYQQQSSGSGPFHNLTPSISSPQSGGTLLPSPNPSGTP